jgi:hypothetical protein
LSSESRNCLQISECIRSSLASAFDSDGGKDLRLSFLGTETWNAFAGVNHLPVMRLSLQRTVVKACPYRRCQRSRVQVRGVTVVSSFAAAAPAICISDSGSASFCHLVCNGENFGTNLLPFCSVPCGGSCTSCCQQGCNRVGLNTVVSRVRGENPVLVSCRVSECTQNKEHAGRSCSVLPPWSGITALNTRRFEHGTR